MRLHAAIAAAALILWTAPSPALAEEGETSLSVLLGYGTYVLPEHTPHGGVVGIDYERGFSDALSWRLSGGLGTYRGGGAFSYSGHMVAGLTYLFDVLKYVPYANVGVGAVAIRGPDPDLLPDAVAVETDVSALLELGVGLDVLRSRSFSYGVQMRFASFVEQTALFTLGVRASWRWGYF